MLPAKNFCISSPMYFFLAAAISVEQDDVNTYLPKGDMWSVHKFGGTCMGTPQRIQSVADIVLGDSSERKLVIVSAMSKVTDMMYNLVHKAQSRDDSYMIALEEVFEKHMAAAKDLLDGEDLASFLSQLHSDVSSLRAMLSAIYIGLHCKLPTSQFMFIFLGDDSFLSDLEVFSC